MDHLDAELIQAVERYALGDLSVSQVEEFERHFFDCPQCSEELRTLTIFQENARAVFVEQRPSPLAVILPQPKGKAGWRAAFSPLFSKGAWAMALAALVLGVFAGYLNFRSADRAQSIGEYPLYAQARGEETIVSPSSDAKFYTLYFDKTWDGRYSSYTGVVKDMSGANRLTILIPTDASSETFHILIPLNKLSSGKYVLDVFAHNGDKIIALATLPYTLKIK